MKQCKWQIKSVDTKSVNNIAETFGLSKTIARLMSLKGIKSKNISNSFYSHKESDTHDPFLMQDMDKAADRMVHAIKTKDTILIFGDFDADGTTSVAFLTLFLQSISNNLEVYYYIPNRYNEGYGLSKKGIDYAKYIGANILITCDCGITNIEEVAYAQNLGIDVIITDHHQPSKFLPDAYAIINPNRIDCNYPFKGLCGAGVVFKLAIAICKKASFDQNKAWAHTDLITLGIAADMVPINDENRVIVIDGLSKIKNNNNLGISSLIKTSRLVTENITIGKIIFGLIPKINAAGRLGDASRAVKLLVTKNPVLSYEIAKKLEKENDRRKNITQKIVNDAQLMVESDCDLGKEKIIILKNKGWHIGVIGIVASQIKELYNRPAVIIAMEELEGKGSCRSIPNFDLVNALNNCKDLLLNYGGHPMAAGLSIKKNNYKEFKKKLLEIAEKKINKKDLEPVIHIDAEVSLKEINQNMINFLNVLEPYGPKNSKPIFISRNLFIEGIPQIIGKNQNSIKFSVKEDKTPFESIGFNMINHYEKLIQNLPIDIAYVINESTWNNKKSIQLELKDIRMGS